MSKDILIVVRHGPYGGFQAAEAMRHANGSISLGFRPVVVLVDDGVYLAKEGQEPSQSQWLSLSETLEEIIVRGLYEKKDNPAEFYVEQESLLKRGLEAEDLVEDLQAVDHNTVSELMANNPLQLIF
ncbi:MAG: DsrE family protein [Desulfobacteraceae bacterium]